MTSVLKYLTKKIQPFRQCVEIPESPDSKKSCNSFTKNPENSEQKKISKKTNKKRKFNLKLKRSIKSNLSECIKQSMNESTAKHVDSAIHLGNETEKMEISSDIFEDPKPYNIHSNTVFNTPVSNNSDNFNHELNIEFSPFNNEFGSNIDQKRASCSTYDADCFPFQSVSKSSPANYTNNSMLTYNTKYDTSSSHDDEMMSNSESLIRQPSITINNHMQQSTPYGRNKRISNQIVKSQTTNFNKFAQLNEARTEVKKETTLNRKCRRSNTTYTLAGKSSRIIDYFTNLELSKPLLLKANSRQVSRQSSRKNMKQQDQSENKMEDFYTMFNDIEKLQDAFFNDSSINKNEVHSSDESSNEKNDSYYRKMNSITPPSSSSNTFDSSVQKSENSEFFDESSGFKSKTDSENNSSIEKVRRAISSPGLILQDSLIFDNVSKISPVKNLDRETKKSNEKMEETGSNSNMTETLTLINSSNKDSTQISQLGEFKRGQPNNRSSKKIKQMFKSVLEKQMNALNKLEKFYETQVVFLEESRQKDLKENPQQKDLINKHYDERLEQLEERVQTNLQYISENKSRHSKSEKENKVKNLTHTISQIMLLKQLQQTNNTQNNKSRALIDLKSNLINQNNLLPSKISLPVKRHSDAFEMSDSQEESAFKRHLSLPFKQTKNVSFTDRQSHMSCKISRSPKMLAYSSSRAKYNKHISAANTLTSSPVTSLEPVQTRIQYQKNTKKFSTSTENISQLRFRLSDDLSDNGKTNEVMQGSKFAQIKRQNKSVSSIKSEQVLDDMTINDESYRFSAFGKNSASFALNSFALDQSSHLVKYAAPRLSDCHIHYKIKMASKNDKLNYANNQHRLSQNSIATFETEV
ncbi:unnamed protein product [Brachionus calyciflorus]|uniref:Uncharacterized protein n=1 Tax=Brachionus calyciflorus TaxID=104777 RepID=A0A813MHS5_9BILA|nr:unnamed protein product [Brachionus calyciflorus]